MSRKGCIFSMIALLLVFITTLAYAASWEALTPEETLFAHTRCMEVHAEGLIGADRKTVIDKWRTWQITDNKNNTRCFVKCVLEKLELLVDGKFMPERIDIQHNAYKGFTKVEDSVKDKFKKKVGTLTGKYATCNTVYGAVSKILDVLPAATLIYLDNNDIAEKIYLSTPSIRHRKQSYFSFCESLYYPNDHNTLCKIRKYSVENNIVKDRNFTKLITCIFKGLRYFDRNDKFNLAEMLRDFRLAKQVNHVAKLQIKLNKCDKSKPVEVYKCLVKEKDDVFKAFTEAFDYREVRSRDYKYRFDKPDYDKRVVQEEIQKTDDGICK